MDDDFLSFTINLNVNVLTFLGTMSKLYIEERPNVSEVSLFTFIFSEPTNVFYTSVAGM